MRKTLTTLLALAGALALHAQDGGGQAVFGGFQLPEVKMEYSVKYADVDYAGDGEVFHRLDIYLPEESRESYPVVIHIYGSAWYSNNSKGMADLGTICQALLDAGYFAALQTEEGFVTFCVTEKHTAQEVDEIIETVKAL